jgi:hypothetical protein
MPSFPTNGREREENFPYHFVEDEAFPLKVSITTPYLRIMPTNKRQHLITDSLVSVKM